MTTLAVILGGYLRGNTCGVAQRAEEPLELTLGPAEGAGAVQN